MRNPTPARRRVLVYREVPNNSVFRVLKEQGYPTPRAGRFVKIGQSHATCNGRDHIFALADVVRVERFPDEHKESHGTT